jgi:hypothetical protein
LDASTEGVGGTWKEDLTGAGRDLPSYRPPFDFAQAWGAVRIVRLDVEPTQGLAALRDRALQLGPEPVRSQGASVDSIEPDGTRMADLRLERKRLLAKEESVSDGSVALPLRKLVEQVGRDLPAAGRLGGRESHALELAQTSLVRVRGAPAVGSAV